MTTPAEFVEFKQIAELILEVRGEANGLVNGEKALSKKLDALAALVTRAFDQTESITRRAKALSERARRDVAALSADPVRDELAALRAQAHTTLR